MEINRELLVCGCGNLEHQLVFTYFDDEPEVYVEMHLKPLPFWERLRLGIKYIFGYQSRYGSFDEIILNKSHISTLNKVIDKLNEDEGTK